ncbi:MAG: TorF family putative porin [Pseudomonadota bacterium]
MTTLRKTLLATALMGATAAAHAELLFNVAAASNYYFRGVSQTSDDAAVSGGVDWGHDSGFYIGTWMSNVEFASAEVDVYGGFGSELDNGLGYDVGALYYYYPDGGNIDYAEVYGNLSFGMFSGGIAYTVYGEVDGDGPFDSGDIYYNAAVDLPFDLGEGVGLGIFAGYYTFDDSDTDSYGHWGVSLSKDAGDWGSVSVNYEQTNEDDTVSFDDSAKFWFGWSKEF